MGLALAPEYARISLYLYPSIEAAEKGESAGGTGFVLGVPAPDGNAFYQYVVTNAHVVEAGNLGDSEGLLNHLAENHGLAVVAGVYFSLAGANWIRFSYALPPEKTEGAVKRLFEGLNALL